jgi:hypothetical protein
MEMVMFDVPLVETGTKSPPSSDQATTLSPDPPFLLQIPAN